MSLSGPFKDEEEEKEREKAKYVRDYVEGQETAEADLKSQGPNTSLVGGLVDKVRDIIDPSEGRDDGYEDRIEEGRNDDEDDEQAPLRPLPR
ncbi:MAG TPA: hypothetical protein VKM72_27420 [Thermoanaerobaculia bacterium]|nr:hypothetical protein [Thermoanaerobaculia bacterium]